MNDATTSEELNAVTEEQEWLTVAECVEYSNGKISSDTIYVARKNGMPSSRNANGLITISKDVLEHRFCPFKENADYGKSKGDVTARLQVERIREQQTRIADLEKHIQTLKDALELCNKEKSVFLDIIYKNQYE